MSNAQLTPQQMQVIELLLAGSTVVAAAAKAGISRSTIYHWTRADLNFRAALQAARERRVQDVNERIHDMGDQAISILHSALTGGDVKPIQLRAALAILKMIRQDEEKAIGHPRQLPIESESAAAALTAAPVDGPLVDPMHLFEAGLIGPDEFLVLDEQHSQILLEQWRAERRRSHQQEQAA
jgi:hypothetical protein